MLNIYINGCSFSQSQLNYVDRSWTPYSDLIERDLNIKVSNKSISSSGQGRILDNSIIDLELFDKYDLVIIQWSAVSRGYSTNYNQFVEKLIDNPSFAHLLHEDEYLNSMLKEGEVTDVLNHIEDFYYHSSLSKIIAMRNYLENKKIPYLFFWGWQQLTDEVIGRSDITKKLVDNLYNKNWWRFGEHGGLSEWGIDKFGKDKAILPEDFHPTTIVHSHFYSEVIKPYLNIFKNNHKNLI